MAERSCTDCRWAEWRYTLTGRLTGPGRCVCPREKWTIILPRAATEGDYYREPTAGQTLWPREPFTNCPTWEAKSDG